ncbi:MAG: LamG domain-containing protein [Verrucomicrobia bacterium]|nr:LamG domain-containing protein [Verrucomicrobiota bacterium]
MSIFRLQPCKSLGLAVAMVVIFSLAGESRAQLLEWKFDEESGEVAESSGTAGSAPLTMKSDKLSVSLFTPDAGGASGKPGDRAFDLSGASGMGANNPPYKGPVGIAKPNTEGLSALGGLESLTITGWLKPSSTLTGAARIVVAKTFSVQAGSSGELQFAVIPDSGQPIYVNSAPRYTEMGMWMFFAITYDGTRTMDNVNFYVGATGAGLELVCTLSIDGGKLPPFSGGLEIGNSSAGVRPFQGMIDDLAIYGAENGADGALSQAKIEEIYNKIAKP